MSSSHLASRDSFLANEANSPEIYFLVPNSSSKQDPPHRSWPSSQRSLALVEKEGVSWWRCPTPPPLWPRRSRAIMCGAYQTSFALDEILPLMCFLGELVCCRTRTNSLGQSSNFASLLSSAAPHHRGTLNAEHVLSTVRQKSESSNSKTRVLDLLKQKMFSETAAGVWIQAAKTVVFYFRVLDHYMDAK